MCKWSKFRRPWPIVIEAWKVEDGRRRRRDGGQFKTICVGRGARRWRWLWGWVKYDWRMLMMAIFLMLRLQFYFIYSLRRISSSCLRIWLKLLENDKLITASSQLGYRLERGRWLSNFFLLQNPFTGKKTSYNWIAEISQFIYSARQVSTCCRRSSKKSTACDWFLSRSSSAITLAYQVRRQALEDTKYIILWRESKPSQTYSWRRISRAVGGSLRISSQRKKWWMSLVKVSRTSEAMSPTCSTSTSVLVSTSRMHWACSSVIGGSLGSSDAFTWFVAKASRHTRAQVISTAFIVGSSIGNWSVPCREISFYIGFLSVLTNFFGGLLRYRWAASAKQGAVVVEFAIG